MIPDFFKKIPYATCGRAETVEEFIEKYKALKIRDEICKPQSKTPLLLVSYGEDAVQKERCEASLSIQSTSQWEVKHCAAGELVSSLRGLCSGEGSDWIGLLNGSAFLSPVALSRFNLCIATATADIVYPNEVWLDERGHFTFVSKRDYAPVTQKAWNVVGPCFLVRRTVLAAWLKLQPVEMGWDAFVSSLVERSTASSVLSEFLVYRPNPMVQSIVFHTPRVNSSTVTAIICFKNHSAWTVECLRRLALQKGVEFEVVLVNNDSFQKEATFVKEAATKLFSRIQIIDFDEPFNFARMHNIAVSLASKSDAIFFLNNDVFLRGSEALSRMVEMALSPGVGTVGMCLEYPGGSIQHAGLEAGWGGSGRMIRIGNRQSNDFLTRMDHECMGNTFAACVVKRSLFHDLKGLREDDLINGFGDVAFNLECLRKGLRNIYLGTESAIHFESGSRGRKYEYWEESVIERDYPELLNEMLRKDFGTNKIAQRGFAFRPLVMHFIRWSAKQFFPWAYTLRQAYYWRRITAKLEAVPKIEYKQMGLQQNPG